MSGRKRLHRSFYRRDTLRVARDLLGRVLCHRLTQGGVLRGRIVEIEAYDGTQDRASHAYAGRTRRNAPMFEAGGIAYVYLIYGMHHCLNIVTGEKAHPAAVLLRAVEPETPGVNASGPGRLCLAFRIDRSRNGHTLLGRELWLEEGQPVDDAEVLRTRRIGVAYAGAWARRRLRFLVKDSAHVSGPRRMR